MYPSKVDILYLSDLSNLGSPLANDGATLAGRDDEPQRNRWSTYTLGIVFKFLKY